jgi:hypothetical protein
LEQLLHAGQNQENRAWVIALADRLAHSLVLGDSGNDIVYPLHALVAEADLGDGFIDQLRNQIPEETEYFKYSLLATSNCVESMVDAQCRLRDKIPEDVKVFCPDTPRKPDAFQLLFRQLGCLYEGEKKPPTLALLQLHDLKQTKQALDRYEKYEQQEFGKLPMIVICHDMKLREHLSWLEQRWHKLLFSPTSIEQLVEAMESLLDG